MTWSVPIVTSPKPGESDGPEVPPSSVPNMRAATGFM
jgi:hypothetical protein